MSDWTSEYLQQITDCEARESRLSEWDCTFLDSIKKQLERGIALTIKQTDKLDEVWEKATKKG